jgi:hypothetical protein
MPSDKTKTAITHRFVHKFTGKLYKSQPAQPGSASKAAQFCRAISNPVGKRSVHLGNLNKVAARGIIGSMPASESTRRWPRVEVDMPVRVVTSKGFSTTVVEGRGTELSEGGMVLYAGILLNPGDLLEIEFETPTLSRLTAIVRSRNGFCFGLEFITPLPS